MAKIGGKYMGMDGRADFDKKKVGKNVKMLHVGVFLNNKKENRYSAFS